MASAIDGPRLAAKSGGAPKQLVVLLHGYGANGKDLIAIGQQWQAMMPDAAFVAPNAPEPCGQAPMGRQWFPLTMRDPDERWVGCEKAMPGLDAFLDEELANQGLDDGKLAIVGFSQGTMMALHVGLRRRRAPAAIVGFSGMLVDGPQPLVAQSPAPPVLLTHGSDDDVIPADALFMSAEGLADAGVPCQWHLSVGVSHGIDAPAMSHAALFIGKSFGLKTAVGPVTGALSPSRQANGRGSSSTPVAGSRSRITSPYDAGARGDDHGGGSDDGGRPRPPGWRPAAAGPA